MSHLNKIVLGVSTWVLFLGACGPAPETEGTESIAPGVAEVAVPGDTEADEPGTVSQMTFVRDLGSVLGSAVATYNSCTASNQWRTTCGSGSSRDISYLWRVPTTGAYAFSTRGSSFDTILEIRNYRNTSQVLACNDDAGGGYQSALNLSNLAAGTLLLITIEGYEGECGTAQLNIARR